MRSIMRARSAAALPCRVFCIPRQSRQQRVDLPIPFCFARRETERTAFSVIILACCIIESTAPKALPVFIPTQSLSLFPLYLLYKSLLSAFFPTFFLSCFHVPTIAND